MITAARAIGAAMQSRRVEALLATALVSAVFFVFLWRILLSTIVANPWQRVALAAAFSLTLGGALAARGLRASSGDDDPVACVLHALSPRLTATTPGLARMADGARRLLVGRRARQCDRRLELRCRQCRRCRDVDAGPGDVRALRAHPDDGPAPGADCRHRHRARDECRMDAGCRRRSARGAGAGRSAVDRRRSGGSIPGQLRCVTTPRSATPISWTCSKRTPTCPPRCLSRPSTCRSAPPAACSLYRPHIFLFVIESMCRDYLGAYNPARHIHAGAGSVRAREHRIQARVHALRRDGSFGAVDLDRRHAAAQACTRGCLHR